jgi:hypothetical protein
MKITKDWKERFQVHFPNIEMSDEIISFIDFERRVAIEEGKEIYRKESLEEIEITHK